MSELSRLRWRCRRGMKELDVLFERFLANRYNDLPDDLRQEFGLFVECEDIELQAWLLKGELSGDATRDRLIHLILSR